LRAPPRVTVMRAAAVNGEGIMRAYVFPAAVAAFLVTVPALAASQKDWSDCRGKDANKSTSGCTRVLQDKKLTARERAEAYYNRGLAHKANDDLDKAIADYTAAINADPKWAVPYAKRGDLYDDKGDHDRAIADLSDAIGLDPDYAWAYAIRGYIYDNRGEHDRAIADYTQSLRIGPKDAGTLANRG
jgi:tetratricopeptide (TPR) repeat protein